MSVPKDDRVYLWDMLTAARAVVDFTRGRKLAEYETDLLLRSADERQIEIIGEAARRISKAYQEAHPEISVATDPSPTARSRPRLRRDQARPHLAGRGDSRARVDRDA